jgi:hypothetical protein
MDLPHALLFRIGSVFIVLTRFFGRFKPQML